MENLIRLPLDKAYNVRELGGYATKDIIVKWGRFLRGDDLSQLSASDIKYLKNYGVTSVLDLRSHDECRTRPDAITTSDDIAHFHVPFMVGQVDNIMDTVKGNFNLGDFYVGLLKEFTMVKTLLRVVANAPEGCMLFHCAAGKDRTGVLSMLLLSLVGIDKEDIMANYQVSQTNLLRNAEIMNVNIPKNMDPSCMYSDPSNIERCLSYISENFGTTEDYIKHCGLSEEDIQKIKYKLLQ